MSGGLPAAVSAQAMRITRPVSDSTAYAARPRALRGARSMSTWWHDRWYSLHAPSQLVLPQFEHPQPRRHLVRRGRLPRSLDQRLYLLKWSERQ